jgi:hypothetical protein
MALWLAEQDFDDAAETFGGSIRNVWQMLERPTLRPLAVRQALLDWLRSLPPDSRSRNHERATFAELMKALRARLPDRGPGSAKRPVHYEAAALRAEVAAALAPFAH